MNPRSDPEAPRTVFETAAFDRSATPPSERNRPAWACVSTEKEGFEPSMEVNPHNALAGRRLQPLGHSPDRGWYRTSSSGYGTRTWRRRARREGTVRLRLAVRSPAGEVDELELEAHSSLTVRDAAEALARELAAPSAETLTLARTGEELSAGLPLLEAGLRQRRRARPRRRERVGAADPCRAADRGRSGRRPPASTDTRKSRRRARSPPRCRRRRRRPLLRARAARGGRRRDGDYRGSRNGTAVDGVTLESGPEPLPRGALVSAGRSLLRVAPTAAEPPSPPGGSDGTIPFNRPPRVIRPREEAIRPFPAPPADPQRARLPFGASLPLGLEIGLYLVTGIPTMLLFAALSPMMAVSTYIEDRRSGRKGFERRSRQYHALLAEARDELEAERRAELRRRHEASPSAVELLRRARTLDSQLWERRPGDPDFLELRLGAGTGPARLRLQLDRGGNRSFGARPEAVGEWYSILAPVPVTAPLVEATAVGLCGAAGPGRVARPLARRPGCGLSTPHASWRLPRRSRRSGSRGGTGSSGSPTPLRRGTHCRRRSPPARRRRDACSTRRANSSGSGAPRPRRRTAPHGARRPRSCSSSTRRWRDERALVAETLAGAADAAVVAIWLGSDRRDLPGECGAIVELDVQAHPADLPLDVGRPRQPVPRLLIGFS